MPEEKKSSLQDQLSQLRREGEERDAKHRAEVLGYPYVNVTKTPISTEALKLIPEDMARAAKMAAMELRVREIAIAAFDPRLPEAAKALRDLEAKKYSPKVFVVSLSGLEQAWRLYAFLQHETLEITGNVKIEKQHLKDLRQKIKTFGDVKKEIEKFDFSKLVTAPLLEVILAGAVATRASDVHLEAEEKSAKIRFRLDGLLHDVFGNIPLKNYGNLVSRIKLLSRLKINVYGEPQDGRFSITLGEKEVEMRVSIIPSEFGETIVMRILDPEAAGAELGDLGLRPDDSAIVERNLSQPNGLILNTGPTGSGKTTTLYAFLRKLNNPESKVITIEDPIEYRIGGIEQTQIDAGANYTFARGLRAIVRQDPDVILVGEIRDLETADIALQAALTGHLVLSTLHTNDAVGAVPRLVNLGVKPATIGPALSLVIAQRLVRRLCPECRKPVVPEKELQAKISRFLKRLPARVERAPYEKPTIYKADGCSRCNGLGYGGRTGIFEFLEAKDKLEEAVLRDASEVALKKIAAEQGMVAMQEDGILKVLRGETDLAEVERVTGAIEW